MGDQEPGDGTTPIYDISGKSPVLGEIPHSQVQAAVASGKFSFPKGKDVMVVAPDGTHGTIPAHHAPAAFSSGYQYATPEMQAAQADQDKYGTPGQQVLTGLEGLSQGVAGPLAPAAERLFGVDPTDIRKRAEINPWTHGLSEAGGFVGGLFTGASEASLLGHAGEMAAAGATRAITHEVAKSASQQIGAKLVAGSARAATELALLQAGSEATKVILDAPNSVGQAAVNIGLSGLLGAVGGGAITGTGMVATAGLRATGLDTALKEFTDRLAYRGANLSPNEAIHHEIESTVNAFHEMGSEVGGTTGMRARALGNILPQEMTPEISAQIQSVATKSQEAVQKMVDQGVPERLIKKFQSEANRFMEVATDPAAKVTDHFDALNTFKRDLQDYAKGQWGPFAVKSTDEAYDFIQTAKNLSREIRTGLESPETWGKPVADLQANLNKAWSETIPAVKDIESKFMSKVGNERVVDPAKLSTYVNQNGKATTLTVRQQMMGKFSEAMKKFHGAVDQVYEKAGVPNPHPPLGMSAIQDSLEKKSPWAKVADLYYDRALSNAAGTTVGAGVGGAVGHATGIPGAGIAGSLLGGKIGEKVLPAIIQPLLTKSMNSGALQQSVKFAENVIKGNSQLLRAAKDVFVADAKLVPQHMMTNEKGREKIDKKLEYAAANPAKMFDVAGDLGHYMPNHQMEVAKHAQTAVNYLSGLRPSNPKMRPLDSKIPPSKDQIAKFNRALDIAEQPLLVLHHLKASTLLPDDLVTLKTVYPALYPQMVQEVMGSMTEHLSKGEEIPYRLRQSLSLFTGEALDSTLTPASIMSIQSVFLPKQPQQTQGGAPPPKSTAKLNKIATNTQTASQARDARAAKV